MSVISRRKHGVQFHEALSTCLANCGHQAIAMPFNKAQVRSRWLTWTTLPVVMLVAVGLAGCGEPKTSCSDETTLKVVRGIYEDAIKQTLEVRQANPDVAAQIAGTTAVEVRSIKTVGKDAAIGRMSCEASLSIKLPKNAIEPLKMQGHPLNSASQMLSLTFSADRAEKTISYTTQMTDDRKQVSVSARGVMEMAQLVGTLGSIGVLKARAPDAAPTMTPPTLAVSTASASPVSPAAPVPVEQAASNRAADTPETFTSTRFGKVRIDGEQRVSLDGALLSPALEFGDRLRIVKTLEVDDRDAVLIEAINGSACPTTFYMLTVSKKSISGSPSFGTCSDSTSVTQAGDTVRLTMPGFAGKFESRADQTAAAQESHVFLYRNGAVTEEDQPKAVSAVQSKPSFDCTAKLSLTEQLICDTPALSRADAALALAYAKAVSAATDPAALKQRQRDWRKTRDVCGKADCVQASYAKRIEDLSR